MGERGVCAKDWLKPIFSPLSNLTSDTHGRFGSPPPTPSFVGQFTPMTAVSSFRLWAVWIPNFRFSSCMLILRILFDLWLDWFLFNRNSLVSVTVTLRNGTWASLEFPSASLTLSNDTWCADNCPVPLLLLFCCQALLCANPNTLSPTSFLRWFAIAEANSYLQQDTAPTT